jgi:hypothetical protein
VKTRGNAEDEIQLFPESFAKLSRNL